ncbi:RNA polymerase sigma-70 factor (ECF subfamily) [Mucilaginibacter sp. SG538B]|uniref:RNA polymerase sigma-70 factor n=1 Tax=unclassified Mucilaginibacter TaxID=2617802 RepID=UPI00159D3CD1|nr:RNA polymerase sigma-70 factor [Mucilaginibacter sp. SG538B]NVM65542.1 RNA polymerase sigma-70 factor (ECF subfamily) [Mucilaginibacter sp. SG538B]
MRDRKVDTLKLWKLICNNDDENAFELFFHVLNNSLIKFCVLYVHQREIAEEIVSDVFVKCWLNRKNLTEIQNPETYLFVAVKNQSLNHIKKYSTIHVVQIEETNTVEFVNTYNPQKEIENKELIFRMDQAIAGLPQQCRIVFRLIKEDGMKYKEVAEILNISPRTVQTQLFRAIKKLSVVLTQYNKHHEAVLKPMQSTF